MYLDAINGVIDQVAAARGPDFWRVSICSLACGRVVEDPYADIAITVKEAIVKTLGAATGFMRDGVSNHPAAPIDFELVGALAAHLGDPDAWAMRQYRRGVRLGWRRRLPRTPAVFARKV